MNDADDIVGRKVAALFTDIAGERAERLGASRPAVEAERTIELALAGELGEERAREIGFHLADWGANAAFLVALHLFPERFTDEEIRAGITSFLIHAPNHVAAAAHLAGWPIQDVFKIGVLSSQGK